MMFDEYVATLDRLEQDIQDMKEITERTPPELAPFMQWFPDTLTVLRAQIEEYINCFDPDKREWLRKKAENTFEVFKEGQRRFEEMTKKFL